jgi:phosphate transport system substrate-binding protein
MKTMKKFIFSFISVLFLCGCLSVNSVSYIRIQGSDTMKILVSLWAEEYMKQHKNVSIYASGGGSAQGIRALIDGEIDICASSRPLLPHEVRDLAAKHNRLGISFLVAKDALSVYINPENRVKNLTLDEIQKIFTGEIKNWKEVGGQDEKIYVINRSPNSGTFYYFKEHVLSDMAYVSAAEIRHSTQEVVNAVKERKNAIGYGGTAYGAEVDHCRINNVSPTMQNVLEDKYPISRYLYLYTIDTPRGAVADFIDWILDEPGQAIVATIGYIPLWQKKFN